MCFGICWYSILWLNKQYFSLGLPKRSMQLSWQAHHQSSRKIKANRYSFWSLWNLLLVHLHLHLDTYIRWTCINFFSQRCYSCFSTMVPHQGKMMTSSKLVHRIDAANMDQRSGFRFDFQPTHHHAGCLGCSYHALGTTRSWIFQFLAPTKWRQYITGIASWMSSHWRTHHRTAHFRSWYLEIIQLMCTHLLYTQIMIQY